MDNFKITEEKLEIQRTITLIILTQKYHGKLFCFVTEEYLIYRSINTSIKLILHKMNYTPARHLAYSFMTWKTIWLLNIST